MRNVLSLMFALDADQVARFNHYVLNDNNEYDMANICLHIPVVTRNTGRFETMIETINIQRDSLTKNIALTLHLLDRDGIGEAMAKDDCIFNLGMSFSPRSKKMNLSIAFDGHKA